MSSNPISRRGFVLAAALLSGAALAQVARPNKMIADQSEKLDLEKLFPTRFATWRVDESLPVVLPAPDLQAALNAIYNQTVARTYVDDAGNHIMLSVAYGRNQSDAVQVHKPEGCYTGQGFAVSGVQHAVLPIQGKDIPVRRIIAARENRHEPVTYWILIGDAISAESWREKVVQLGYGLERKVPDGLLVRVSSIDRDENKAFKLQERFLSDMVEGIDPSLRSRVIGQRYFT